MTDEERAYVQWLRWVDYREAAADYAAERRTDTARNTARLGPIDRCRASTPAPVPREIPRARRFRSTDEPRRTVRPVVSCGPWT